MISFIKGENKYPNLPGPVSLNHESAVINHIFWKASFSFTSVIISK